MGKGRVSEYMGIKVEESVLGVERFKWRQESQGYGEKNGGGIS